MTGNLNFVTLLIFGRFFVCLGDLWGILVPGGEKMKEDEKKQPNWEMVDPKPPVIRSGHMDNRKR